MRPLTQHQKDCIAKAKQYRKTTFSNRNIRRLYIDFCKDGNIKTSEFLSIINGNNVIPLRRKKIDPQPILDYINFYENEVLGKAKAMEKING